MSSSSLRVGAGPVAKICASFLAPARPAQSPEQLDQFAQLDELHRLRLAHGASQRLKLELRAEIYQRARHGGDRDHPVARDVGRLKQQRAVNADAGVASGCRPGHGHLGVPPIPAHEPDQRGVREVAEERPKAARLHGREQPALERRVGMAYRIHAAMHAMKVSPPHSPAHAVDREAAVAQLLEREHAPLAGCAARDEQVGAAPRRARCRAFSACLDGGSRRETAGRAGVTNLHQDCPVRPHGSAQRA